MVAVFAIAIYEPAEKLALSCTEVRALVSREEEDFAREVQV